MKCAATLPPPLEAFVKVLGQEALVMLGLHLDKLHDSLLFANAERNTYTDLDAPGAREFATWTRTVRGLSEAYLPLGWGRENPKNQPTLIHPGKSHCLVVTSGDQNTGNPHRLPRNKNPKGTSVREAVEINHQYELLRREEVAARKTWYFLINFDDELGVINSEVSLPDRMDGADFGTFDTRIILPPIDPSSPARYTSGPEPLTPATPVYEVQVFRR